MAINNVVVAGGGVLGSQIAFQTAFCGFNVTIWL
jgi:3-hydroxybutyryl-CoA dehydrogenase